MSRLPVIDNYQIEPETVGSYISDRADIKQRVCEVQSAAKLEVTRLNDLRKKYAKERGLFTPGVDFILKLREEFSPDSAREWLRGFDVAREVVGLDELLGVQTDLLENIEREDAGRESAEAAV